MAHRYAELMFSESVKAAQEALGSRAAYARPEDDEATSHERLGPKETAFVAARDSFYIATASAAGWPYIQHRGGPAGFLKVLDQRLLGFADYAGNRQYISLGNLADNDRCALFLMDYAARRRLKIIGRARVLERDPSAEITARIEDPAYGARIERVILIGVEAFDWNCSQHITPRFSEAEAKTRFACAD